MDKINNRLITEKRDFLSRQEFESVCQRAIRNGASEKRLHNREQAYNKYLVLQSFYGPGILKIIDVSCPHEKNGDGSELAVVFSSQHCLTLI